MTNITSKYLNQDKREGEGITATLPAVSNVGGGRSQLSPVYNQFGEDYRAYVFHKNTVIGKVYLDIAEPFPAGATVTVTVGNVVVFTGQAVDVQAFVVSTSEDLFFRQDSFIDINVAGGTGDITQGKLHVAMSSLAYLEKNGRYASYPHDNDHTQAR